MDGDGQEGTERCEVGSPSRARRVVSLLTLWVLPSAKLAVNSRASTVPARHPPSRHVLSCIRNWGVLKTLHTNSNGRMLDGREWAALRALGGGLGPQTLRKHSGHTR
jgi:hypothetical protein